MTCDYSIDYEYGIELDDGYTITAKQFSKKETEYVFYENRVSKSKLTHTRQPNQLSLKDKIGTEINKHMETEMYKKHVIDNNFRIICENLQEYYELSVELQKEVERHESEEKEKEYQLRCKEGLDLFESIENPLIYIGSIIDWNTAGERRNILLTFLCFSSQIILKHPISVIGLGEGSSGKTHIQNVALSMIPKDYILYEKKPTLASMFRRAETNEYYYDGKIVVYGDMGGANDQDEVEETKNLLKELQTDGYLVRPITIKVDGEYKVVDLILRGFPCLTYTTIPSYDFDDQELSRSFTYTPRTDNKNIFNARKSYLELKGSTTEILFNKMKKELDNVKLMIEGLKCKFDKNILIVNIYTDVILDFIGNSDYYKRDFDKINSILKCISVFNSHGRPIYTINGQQVMFVEPLDIILFLSLIEGYDISISANLPLKAGEIYRDISENLHKIGNQNSAVYDTPEKVVIGFTVSDYMDNGNVDITKRSLQRYFKDLNNQGYFKIIGKDGRSNIYTLNKMVNSNHIDLSEYIPLSDNSRARLCEEYPEEIVREVLKRDFLDATIVDTVNIMNQHENVVRPKWCDYDINGGIV
ncbi:MAG: hypothetical protein J6M08_00090 [Methanobrevibacter sp.]|nr:hypothetical protein [Methanobrevibacter sp.]